MTSCSYCTVDGCLNQRCNKELTFFTLPKEEDRRQAWLRLIGRPDLLERENLIYSNYRVCSAHFEEAVIVIVKKLQPDALPSKHLPKEPIPCSKTNTSKKSKKTGKKKKSAIDYSHPVPQYSVWKQKKNRKTSRVKAPQKMKLQLIVDETKKKNKKILEKKYKKIQVELDVEHLKTEVEHFETELEHEETEVKQAEIELGHTEKEVGHSEKKLVHTETVVKHRDWEDFHTEIEMGHTDTIVENREIEDFHLGIVLKHTETQEKHPKIKVKNIDFEVRQIKTEETMENIQVKQETDYENQEMLFEEIDFEPMYIKEEVIDGSEEMQDWPLTLYPFRNKYFG